MGSAARSARKRTQQNSALTVKLPTLSHPHIREQRSRKATAGEVGAKRQTSSEVVARRATPVGVERGGAVKHDSQKPDYSLLTPAMLEPMTQAMMYGQEKYSRGNFRAGFENIRLTSAALRHIFAYLDREDLDPESNVSHLGHAMAALAMLLDNIHEGVSTDVRYEKNEKTTR